MAQIVDLEEQQNSRQRSVEFSNYGFIVSHRGFGRSSFLSNRNWTLTLTGLLLPYVKIFFEAYTVSKPIDDEFCGDETNIKALTSVKIDSCDMELDTNPLYLDIDSSQRKVSINFKTDEKVENEGFWLSVEGKATSPFSILVI